MKKKLLITTALVAAFTATNAYTMEINTDTEITGEGQAIEPNEKLIVSGGKLVATDTHVYAEGVEVTGGTVILNDGASLKNDNWDESFKLSGGTIIMNGGGDGPSIGTNHSSEEESWEYRGGKFEMTGGNLIVNDSENYIEGGDVSISAGTVDIAEGATLQTAATLIPSGLSPEEGDDAMAGEVAVIKLTDEGTINLSGTLVSDVSGNGNLNVKSSSALVDGDVSGSNLTFEADHSLSKLVSGTIGDLASLNVNKGTLTYDKQTGKIGNMEISQDAGLKVENFVQDADSKDENSVRADNFTSDGNIMLSGSEGSSDITVQNALNITGGSVTALNGDLESFDTVNISGGTLDMKNESDITGLKGVNINGGSITVDNGEIWSLGDINFNGGNVKIDNMGVVSTSVDGLDSVFGEQSEPATAGNINITKGTVIAGNTVFLTKGKISVSGKGVLDIEAGKTMYTSKETIPDGNEVVITNKGEISLTDEGTINLSGMLVSDVSGNGNLNVKISSALVDGDVSGSNLTFEADHSLSKAFSGTIGDLASLNVNKGTLTYDKQTGKIGNLNVAGGLDISTNTVNATNVEFADNSNLALRVAATDNYGKINADKIGIGNETTIKITLDNGVVGSEGKTFKFLNSGNIDGKFTNQIAGNGRYDIVQNIDGSFNVTQKDTTASDVVAEAGGTASNAATAEAWETINNSSNVSAQAKAVSTAIYDLSQETSAAGKKAYVDALTAVAPEVAPMVQKTQTETANQVFGAVSTRLTGGSISTCSEGMSSGDSNPDAAVWVQGMFNKSKLDDTSKAKGFDADSNGVALGIEKFVNKDVKVGAGYAYTNTDIDGFMRSTDVDTHTAILYGEYKPSNWYVNGIATYGWSDYSEDKNVAGVGVKADYDVETFGLQAMTGYDMQVKGFGFTPEAGLRYVHIKQDAYKDSADQKVSGNNSDILTGVIGAKVSKNFELSNGMNIKPEARIAATYDLFNDDVNSVVTLANGSAYAVNGEALDRFGMEFGAGVTAELNSQVELSLGYEGKFREDYQDHTGLINAKYKF